MTRSTIRAILLATAAVGGAAHAQTAANRIAAQRLSPFTTYNSTAAGRALLARNLDTTIAINNGSNAAQRAQAVSDNQIITDRGTQFSTALGPALSTAYAAAVAANDPRLATSGNVVRMFRAFTGVSGADSAFLKQYLANGSSNGSTPATGVALPPGGTFDTYDVAYSPTAANRDPFGNSRPFQTAPDRIQIFAPQTMAGLTTNPAFPSGHTTFGQTEALLTAIMVPERFRQALTRGSEYGFSRVVLGVHYALDTIGGRILAYQDVAALLNNDPNYTSGRDFAALFASATADYRAVLAAGCGGTVAACAAAAGTGDAFGDLKRDRADYAYRLTYGLPSVGRTDLAPVVPTGAEVLLATRFPYLTAQQRRDVLASTELPSGVPLDDGSGWARLDLFAAGGGYGALTGAVTVTQDASRGGFNAFDTWSNDIGGTGSLTKAGTGTLALSGTNGFTGGVTVAGGTLLLLSDGALPARGGVVNAATLSLADGAAGGVATTARYEGRAGSVLALDVDLTRGIADRLVVTGAVTGTSTIAVNAVGAGGAPASPAGGLTLVSAGSAIPADAFALAGGAIDRGLVQYRLGVSGDAVTLAALPGADAQRLPALVTAAQTLWFDGAAAWADHAADIRDTGGTVRGRGLWARGFGRWVNRDQTSTASSAGATVATATDYDQRTYGVLAGIDVSDPGGLFGDDRVTVGVMGGYLRSSQNFADSAAHGRQEGGTVGLSVAYAAASGPFVDVHAKADFTRLRIDVPSLAGFGGGRTHRREHVVGVQADAGYRVRLGAQGFVEPVATIAYANADIADPSLGGGTVSFDDTAQARGRLGLRGGLGLPGAGGGRFSIGVDASVWRRLTGPAEAVLLDGGEGASPRVADRQVRTFGDAGATIGYASAGNLSLFARGGYQFASGYRSAAATAGARLAF